MASQSETVVQVKKVSLKYDLGQDRILMTVQAADGMVLRFWLTYRLCRRLIPSLVSFFDQQSLKKTGSSADNVASVQGFLQTVAKRAKKQAAPIAQSQHGDEQSEAPILIGSLRLRTAKNAVVLAIPLNDSASAVIPFTMDEARQWFDILHQQYKAAEWPLDIWPRWMSDAEQSGSGSTGTRPLH